MAAALGLALTGALALSGCTREASADLPTVGGPTTDVVAADDLEAVATALYNCLRDDGIPAEYETDPSGSPTLITFSDDHRVTWTLPGGYPRQNEGYTQAEEEAFLAELEQQVADIDLSAGSPFETKLEVDGVDHSAVFAQCVETSGYSEDAVYASINWDTTLSPWYQVMVEASNQWAACARENGWPDVTDAHMPQGDEIPTALLPISITEDQLRQLLAVCPIYDPAIDEANAKLFEEAGNDYSTIPEGYQEQPQVGFDYPGFDGDYSVTETSATPSPEEAATRERLQRLQAILLEAQGLGGI
jgi:hypothetical protein